MVKCHKPVINTALVPVKIYFFLFWAGFGTLILFIPVYMKQLNLTATETGIINGVLPFVGFILEAFVGGLVDRWRCQLQALFITSLILGGSYVMLLLVPGKGEIITIDVVDLQCFNATNTCINGTTTSNCEAGAGEMDYIHQCIPFVEGLDQDVISCPDLILGNRTRLCNENHDCISVIFEELVRLTDDILSPVPSSNVMYSCDMFVIHNASLPNNSFDQLTCDGDTSLLEWKNTRTTPLECNDNLSEYGTTFWLFFVIYLFCLASFAIAIPMIDGITYDILGENKNKWGRQRFFGTLGMIVFALPSTIAMDIFGSEGKANYDISFYAFGVLMLIAAADSCLLQPPNMLAKHEAQVARKLWNLAKQPRTVALLLCLIYTGAVYGILEIFRFWYFKDIGSTQTQLGVATVISTISQTIFFLVSPEIFKKLSHVTVLYIVLFAGAIRLIGYSFITDTWQAMPMETLGGVTYSLMWAAGTGYITTVCPHGMTISALSLAGGLTFGVGRGLGSLVTGVLFDTVGERWTFRIHGAISIAVLGLYMIFNACINQQSSKGFTIGHSEHVLTIPEPDPDKFATQATTPQKNITYMNGTMDLTSMWDTRNQTPVPNGASVTMNGSEYTVATKNHNPILNGDPVMMIESGHRITKRNTVPNGHSVFHTDMLY